MTRPVRVQVFARDPVAGRVKTRLVPSLGADGARALYLELTRYVLDVVRAADVGEVELWLDAAPTDSVVDDWLAAVDRPLRHQAAGHLGARMHHALTDALDDGALPILVGSDIGGLTVAHCRDAAAALRSGSPAVFAPAEDGGYGLVGLGASWPGGFASPRWGVPEVMARTRDCASRDGVALTEIAGLWDVDDGADLARLAEVPALAHWGARAESAS